MTGWENPVLEVRETHSGVVALVGDRAYKAKKPVVTGFLDFSTPALREAALEQELGLNRRLAADVYLGLAHVTDPLGGPDEPLLVMRRMPPERRLSTMVRAGEPVADELTALARLVADFHRTARRGPDVDREGSVDAVRERWTNNLRETRVMADGVLEGGTLDRVEHAVCQYLDGRRELFAERTVNGRVVDGHADLNAEDVFCLPDGPRVLDCLDFDVRLRCVDGLDDIAFLAMDLEHLGRPELAEHVLADYCSAADDGAAPASLVHHYLAYRAFVRAKVECLQHTQGHDGAAAQVRSYTGLAEEHLDRGAVRLALVGGLPGTGKTTVATSLAAEVGAVVLSSDRVRSELRQAGTVRGAAGVPGQGAYSPAAGAVVYTELLARARPHLERGVSVVLDASWSAAAHRRAAVELAGATCSRLVPLQCVTPRAVAAHRITHRARGYSEATPAIADTVAVGADPWPQARRIDTSGAVADSVAAASRAWSARPWGVAR